MATFSTEKDVKRKVKRLLKKHGWVHWMPASNGMGRIGVSDFCAVKTGVFMGIETKFGKNKPTRNQIAFLNDINAQDCFGFVVNEETLDALEAWLIAFDRSVEYVSRKEVPPAEDGAMLIDCAHAMTWMLGDAHATKSHPQPDA